MELLLDLIMDHDMVLGFPFSPHLFSAKLQSDGMAIGGQPLQYMVNRPPHIQLQYSEHWVQVKTYSCFPHLYLYNREVVQQFKLGKFEQTSLELPPPLWLSKGQAFPT